jgi:hypothetical protein
LIINKFANTFDAGQNRNRPITVRISLISPLNKGLTVAAFQAMGTSPERRDRLKRSEIALAVTQMFFGGQVSGAPLAHLTQ